MAKIYKTSDRIKINIDDVVVTVSPLTIEQKTEVQALMAEGRIKGDYAMLTKGIVKVIKYSVKDIDGLENADGSKYKVELDNGVLSQETIENIFNIELHTKLTLVCSSLVGSFPTSFRDSNGEPLEGVSFAKSEAEASSPN